MQRFGQPLDHVAGFMNLAALDRYGMMTATARMNKELDAAGGTAIDAAGDKRT
jgi:hypothetical protein